MHSLAIIIGIDCLRHGDYGLPLQPMKTTEIRLKKYMACLLMAGITIFMWSCDTNRLYDRSLDLPEDGWHKDSIAGFTVVVEDTTRLYDFYVTLRNTGEYGFRNFYLFLNTRLPNNHLTRDTLELILADKEGKWLGRGFGAVKDYQIRIRENLKFPLQGEYRFGIEQAMRKERLEGITGVGIRIEYTD